MASTRPSTVVASAKDSPPRIAWLLLDTCVVMSEKVVKMPHTVPSKPKKWAKTDHSG